MSIELRQYNQVFERKKGKMYIIALFFLLTTFDCIIFHNILFVY